MTGIRTGDWLAEVEVTLDPAAYAAGDLMFNPIEVPNACKSNGMTIIQSVTAIDYDDQGVNLDLLFFSQNPGPLGAPNAALLITDAQAAMCQGYITIATWLDVGNQRIGTETATSLAVWSEDATSNGTSIWIAARATAAQTYVSERMTFRLGLLRG